MSALATLGATAISLAGIAYLTATDAKRRRAFRLAPVEGARPGIAWAAVLLPGLLVPFAAGGAGFTVWIGATTVAGWGLAALSPERTAGLDRCIERLLARMQAVTAGLLPARPFAGRATSRADERVTELEARVAALEAEIARWRESETLDAAPAPRARVRAH